MDAIAPTPADRFIEIGPGPGALTTRLADRVGHLTAIEVDRDLAARLRTTLPANVDVIAADFLEMDLGPVLAGQPTRIAGNLPYNISSPILFRLLQLARETGVLLDATIMLQREVADRLVAPVGTAEYGVLTILTSLYAEATRVLALPPGAFRPMPRVHSTVVRLVFRPPQVPLTDAAALERLVRSIFTQRRKTLGNALRPHAESVGRDALEALRGAGIDPLRRPETLDLADLARLVESLTRSRPV